MHVKVQMVALHGVAGFFCALHKKSTRSVVWNQSEGNTRLSVMPYAFGNYIHDYVVIPCQSFGLDRKKQVFRLAFFLVHLQGLDSRRGLRALVGCGRGRPPEVRSVPQLLRVPVRRYRKTKKPPAWVVFVFVLIVQKCNFKDSICSITT